jgi:lipoprotein-anchoring transpeptidase ErfK/SrfK
MDVAGLYSYFSRRRRTWRELMGVRIPRRRHTLAGLTCVAALTIAFAPAASAKTRSTWHPAEATIAPGVFIGTVPVGRKSIEDARTAVRTTWDRPISVKLGKRVFTRQASVAGQKLALQDALDAAWRIGRDGSTDPLPSRTDIVLGVEVKRTPFDEWIAFIERRGAKAPRNARYILRGHKVKVIPDTTGWTVRVTNVRATLLAALQRPAGTVVVAAKPTPLTRPKRAKVTVKKLKPVIVIDRSDRKLVLWSPKRKVRTFSIAVGTPDYPTPVGHWTVVTKQVNPTWNPPDSDWAEGEEPIGPGPDNPLGTRWIGLSASGVGIHGTPNEWSVGTAASHGCMRMRKADVQWLYRRVKLGMDVHILP